MKTSRYHCREILPDGSVGFYSTRTGECVRLERRWADLLISGRCGSFPAVVRDELTQAGLLVEDEEDELEQILRRRTGRSAAFRILTTTACNASCAYCYEKGTPIRTMEPDVAEETADFLIRRRNESGENELQLEWFGGEPLLNPAAIDRICGRLRGQHTAFYSTMMTNGVLLPTDVCRILRDWSLTRVQIPLDGVGKDHARIKNLPERSFSRIIDNVHRLLEARCRVRIRIVHTGDIPRESKLIEFLANEFPADKPDVYLYPLYETEESALHGVMEEILVLEQLMADAGLLLRDRMYCFRQRRGRCFAADGGLTIAPDGRLYSCSHTMQAEHCVGTVRDFREDNEVYRSFISPELPRRCMECVFLPFCMGGCRAAERNMANMFQCHPYSAVIDKIIWEKCIRR